MSETIGWTLIVAGGCWLAYAAVAGARLARERHLQQWSRERVHGNQKLRQRMYATAGRHEPQAEVVARAEYMRGWVWIRVTGRKPRRGEHKMEAHDETMGWALTRRAAQRALDAESRVDQPRGDRGEVSLTDAALVLLGLMVLSFVVSSVGDDMSPGDVVDWIIDRAGEVLHALFS